MEQGTRLNDTYLVLERLGQGGGGIVYKARHERLQTYVVVKQVKEKVKGILEGRAEADILKKLKHTNLPQVYDFLEVEGEIYTVMDYIPGESLDKVIRSHGAFDSQKVYQWALQLADALSYLHSQKPAVIHSDIKPANVMLTPEGNVSLIDFNISLAFDDGWRTSIGISGGYSPPEQHLNLASYLKRINSSIKPDQGQRLKGSEKKPEPYSGETAADISGTDENDRTRTAFKEGEWDGTVLADETVLDGNDDQNGNTVPRTKSLIASIVGSGVDERSDIYSLGATLYHLITGVKPAEDYEEIRPIKTFGVKIGQGFCTIIEKMMELDQKKRYGNGQELLYALKHVYELDKDFVAYKRTYRMQKALAAALCAAGMALVGMGWRTMEWERFTAYNRCVEQAGNLIDAFQYEEAKRVIENALALSPERIEAYEKETLRLYALGNYDEVIAYARDALNNPSYEITDREEEQLLGNILYILGNSYFEKEDYADAIGCFKKALEWNRENSLYFRDYAITLAKTGNIQAAGNALDTAVTLGLGEDSIYMAQGEIAYAKGEDSLTAECLEASIRCAKSEELLRRATLLCVQAYQRLGTDYLDKEIELLEKSENRFGTAASIDISQQLADAYARKANVVGADSEEYYKKALEKFTQLYEKGYATRQSMENLAILYQQMDRLTEAKDMLLRITQQYPQDYRAYKRLAFLEADIQQKKENQERDYGNMREICKKAEELCEKQGMEDDTEMQMLKTMLKDLEEGGWLP